MEQPGWPVIQDLIARSSLTIQVLPTDEIQRDAALEALQVTTRSFLGAVVGECGALIVDDGWLRILGAGVPGLPGVHEASGQLDAPPPLLDVAWDVVGGRFAINGGGLDAPPGEVCYWGPDTLEWSPIGGGHADFVAWALSDALHDFYDSLRWPSWEREVGGLALDHGLSWMPPPFTTEGRDAARASRAAVPLTELHRFYEDVAEQLRTAE